MTGLKPNSEWIAMELEHSEKTGKKLYCVNLLDDGEIVPFIMLEHDLPNGKIML